MGGGQSAPAMVDTVVEKPYPSSAGAEGLSLSQAEMCNGCRLGVDTKITTSNVKLKRESGAISSQDCKRWGEDLKKVSNKFLSASDVARNIVAGVYSVPISEDKGEGGRPGQQYCQEVKVNPEDEGSLVKDDGNIDQSKVKRGRIRKVAGASYSEETKAKIIPSIPFKMTFGATKAVIDRSGRRVYRPVNETFTVTQMTVYHPCPIRVDSVQADAMLSLNDPSDPNAKYIVLIPLRATNTVSPSNMFFNKIATALTNIKEPRPDTGEYQETTIPTGADWSLDKMFTMSGKEGAALVKNGFFTWTGVAGYERYFAGTTVSGNIRTTTIDWKQTSMIDAPQYILLDTPVSINSEDMSILTMSLPVTPPSNAIHPVPGQPNLVYHKKSEPPAPDTLSGGCSSLGANPILASCEGFGTREGFRISERSPDPFVRNAFKVSRQEDIFTPDGMFAVFFAVLSILALILGAYFAVRMINEGYDNTIRDFAEKIGRALGNWAKGVSQKFKVAKALVSGAAGAAAAGGEGGSPGQSIPGVGAVLSSANSEGPD